MFPAFARAIFSLEGMLQFFAIAIALYAAGWLPLVGGILSKFIFISYYFKVILHSALGSETLPEPAEFTDFGAIFGPVFRFFLATTLIWLPALLYVIFVVGVAGFDIKQVSPPILVLLVGIGVVYFPAAIIVAAISDSTLAMLNPMITMQMILRFPGQYLLTVAVWGVLNIIDGALMILLFGISRAFYVPVLTPVLLSMVGLIIPIFTAFILGRLIHQNAEHFKMLGKEDFEEPEWPDALPRGKRSAEAAASASVTATARPAAVRAVDLPAPDDDLEFNPLGNQPDPSEAQPAIPVDGLELPDDDELEFDPTEIQQTRHSAVDSVVDPAVAGGDPDPEMDLSPLELDDVAPAPAPAPEAESAPEALSQAGAAGVAAAVAVGDTGDGGAEEPAGSGIDQHQEGLRSALQADHGEQALAAYHALRAQGMHPELPVRLELRLAGFLEKSGSYEEAVISAQRAASMEMNGPFAPRAIFTAARLLAEKLGNTARAMELYRYVADNFPQDELSMYAADALRKLERSS